MQKEKSGYHDFGVTLSSRIFGLSFALATQSCLAWLLGPADRGSFAICLVYATLLQVCCLVGCDIASVYFVSSKKFTVSEGVSCAFVYGGVGSLLAMVTGWMLMYLPLSFFEKAEPSSFHLALWTIPFSVFCYTYVQILTAIKEFKWYAIFTISESGLILVFSFIYLYLFKWNVRGALFALMCSYLLVIIGVLWFLCLRHSLSWVRPKIDHLKQMFHYGLRYYFGKISNKLNIETGTIILAFFAKPEEIGLFAVASQVATRVMIIPNTLITVLVPRVAGDEKGKPELIAQCFRLTTQMTLIMMIFLVIVAKPVVAALFSAEFAESAFLIQIMTLGVIVRSGGKVIVPYMLGTGRPEISSFSVIIGAIVNIAVLFLLMPYFKVRGAAVATNMGFMASTLLLIFYFQRYSHTDLTQLFTFRLSDWRIVWKFSQAVKIKVGLASRIGRKRIENGDKVKTEVK